MPLDQNNPHKTVTRFACIGFSMYACGFSVPQLRQFCLFTYSPRSKWASFEKMIFFAKIVKSNISQLCSSGGRIKLIIRQIRHEVSVTIHEISIHNWPLQPLSQDYGLASHTTHVVCVNFIREKRNQQFNVDSERQILEKLFHGGFIYSQWFCQKSAERKSPKKYFSYFIFNQ